MPQAFVHAVLGSHSHLRALAIQQDLVLTSTSKSLGVTCLLHALGYKHTAKILQYVRRTKHLRTTASTLVLKRQSGLLQYLSVDMLTTLFRGSVKGTMCPYPISTCLSTGMGVSSFVNSTTHSLMCVCTSNSITIALSAVTRLMSRYARTVCLWVDLNLTCCTSRTGRSQSI
jgi:hypothetical protein